MKKTITEDDFMREVEQWDTRRDQFTPAGWRAIFRYIEDTEEDTGTDTELDIVAICRQFTEYPDLEAAIDYYRDDAGPAYWTDDLPDGTREDLAREWLTNHTTVLDVDGGGVVIVQF